MTLTPEDLATEQAMREESPADLIVRTCAVIRADIEADLDRFEGAPFNGANVSAMFGYLSACVDAPAGMVSLLAEASR